MDKTNTLPCCWLFNAQITQAMKTLSWTRELSPAAPLATESALVYEPQ